MISTVTTSTVTTVTSVTTSAITTTALPGALALIGILVLAALLFQKELTTASTDTRIRRLGSALNIGIIPLLIAFVLIAGTRIHLLLK